MHVTYKKSELWLLRHQDRKTQTIQKQPQQEIRALPLLPLTTLLPRPLNPPNGRLNPAETQRSSEMPGPDFPPWPLRLFFSNCVTDTMPETEPACLGLSGR